MQGHTLGANTTDKFETELSIYFSGGAVEKGKKSSGVIMRSELLQTFLQRYDIPLEQHINGMIEKLLSKSSGGIMVPSAAPIRQTEDLEQSSLHVSGDSGSVLALQRHGGTGECLRGGHGVTGQERQ